MTHQMMQLAIQIGVILFAARLGNMLFTKLRLPSVLGELCAGVLIGPFTLGKLCSGWIFQAAPTSVGVTPELYGLCTIASIVLLFLVGAETDLKMFMRYSAVGSLVGIGGVVGSYITGAAIGVWLLDLSWSDPTAILMGVMSTATSVSITARILSERKRLDSQEGVTILAGAVIDDVLGIIMLAIGMGMIAAQQDGQSISWGSIGWTAVKCLGIWLGATAIGIVASKWVARVLKPCGTHGEVAVLTLGLALIVGGLFEKAHLAMIIGAYVTGLSFSRTELCLMIQHKLHGLYQFFVPIFFVVMGMMVDVSQFADKKILIAGLVYTVVAILAKIIGCGLPTLLFGFTPLGALRVGMGMVPRGEVALIIAGTAAAGGHGEVLGVAVLMTLLTTLAAPPLLIQSFNLKGRGHKKTPESDAENTPTLTYDFPNHKIVNMVFDRIRENLAKEGFFIHQINSEPEIHQARREDKMLTFTCGRKDITVAAAEEVLPFIKMVMSESILDFEAVVRALRKPVDSATRPHVVDLAVPSAVKNPVVSKYLKEANIVVRLQATARNDAIRELLAHLQSRGELKSLDRAYWEVLHREGLMSTGVGDGVACPHARSSSVESLVCAVGITNTPIDFSDDADGRQCRIVILTLTPDTAKTPYMTFIASMMSALNTVERREAVINATSAAEIRKLFLGH